MKRLLVLGAGLLQLSVIKKAKSMGLYVIAADGDPSAIGLTEAHKAIVTNITSEEDVFKIALEEKIDGVIHPCSEVAMSVMGRINDELKLAGVSKEQAIRATNKHLMRSAFEKHGAPSPTSILTTSMEDAWERLQTQFDSEAILKPSRNSGSRGISKVSKGITKIDFEKIYYRALSESRDNSVLIEQFISGPEFSVEIIVWNNEIHVLQVTDKKTTGNPYFVELGHSQPSLYPNDVVEKIKQAAIEGVKALELNNCACHAELKYENGKAYIIEIGARLGGDFISTELTHLSSGIDMVAAAINCALGVQPNLEPTEEAKAACIRYFCPSPGKVKDIKNLTPLQNEKVYKWNISVQKGSIIPAVTSSLCRSGFVIVVDKTPQGAINCAEEIISNVSFEIS